MQGEKAHELAFAGDYRPAPAGDADREPAFHRFQLFPLESVVRVHLVPAEPGDFAQRLDRLPQFIGIQAEKLRLKIRKIQVEPDPSGNPRLPARLAAYPASLSSFVSAGAVRFAHSPARRS